MTHPNVTKYAHIPVMKRLMAIAQRPRGVFPHLPKKHYRRQWKSAGIFSEPWRAGAFAVSGDARESGGQ